LSTALSKCFGTALSGRCKGRPELADTPFELTTTIAALPCRGGEPVLRQIFEPLGYLVTAESLPLDSTFPAWGPSPYFDVTLSATLPIRVLLEHLHLLIPVLDNAKHYWVGPEEIERLIRRGGAWLAAHPDRELITTRALRHDRRMTREALTRLAALDSGGAELDPDGSDEQNDEAEQVVEERLALNDQRLTAVLGAVRDCHPRRIADLGCGEGRLVSRLLQDIPNLEKVVGVDVSMRSLQRAATRLHLDSMAPSMRQRVDLLQGALTYRDDRLSGCDLVTLIEVIEHIDLERLEALERSVFAGIGPRTVIITTPNVEYNALFPTLPKGAVRHRDHRFEWTRGEFQTWANGVADRHGYTVAFHPIGPVDETHGAPTQMGVFTASGSANFGMVS
jgi:3' terminal RNA ribose 2'-O-methyltransferase Hen1